MRGRASSWAQGGAHRGQRGWPEPARSQRFGRGAALSRLEVAWIALAALGLAAAAAAVGWYLSLDRSGSPSRLEVPQVVGLREQPAVRELTGVGLVVRAVEEPGRAPPGIVFGQQPAPRSTLPRAATVTIRVANGGKP